MEKMSHYHDPTDSQYNSVYKNNTPEILKTWADFNAAVFAKDAKDGESQSGPEVPLKYRELIAVAVALTTQCSYCIEAHTKSAVAAGATDKELAETAWVASALRAGGAFAHGRQAFKFAEHARDH